MVGRVVSDKAEKTVTVLVEGKKTHPLYKKSYVWSKKYLVHNELGAKEGDVVSIAPTRPISKRKHFKVIKILGKDVVALGEAAMKLEAAEAIAEVMPAEEESSDESLESSAKTEVAVEKKEVKKKKAVKKKEEKS